MKSNLKIFNEETIEMEVTLKNKINLLQSPINFLNEKEITEIKKVFNAFTAKVERLVNDRNKETKIEKESLDAFDLIIKNFKEMKLSLEKYFLEYEMQVKKRAEKKAKLSTNPSESGSDFSEYADKDKLEISKIFLNTIIRTDQIQELQNKKLMEEEKKVIAEIFNLNLHSGKESILVDFYMNIYQFCLKNKFTLEKISTFLSIMYFIFNYSVMNKKIIKEKSMSIFIDIMDFHSLNRPPYSFEIFTKKERDLLIKYVNDTFFRNYTLFENIFKYNINIYLYTKEHQKIPRKPLPVTKPIIIEEVETIQGLDNLDHLENIPLQVQILKKYFRKDIGERQIIENNILVLSPKKTEFELYEEDRLDKLKTFVNSFYKSKVDTEKEKEIAEKNKELKKIEREVRETQNFLENRIPELIKETDEKVKIANNLVLKNVNIEELNEKKQKK